MNESLAQTTTDLDTIRPSPDKSHGMPKLRGKIVYRSQDVFRYLGSELVKEADLYPAQQVILGLLKAAGDEGLTRYQLLKAMYSILSSKQEISRVLASNQMELSELGLIEIEKRDE